MMRAVLVLALMCFKESLRKRMCVAYVNALKPPPSIYIGVCGGRFHVSRVIDRKRTWQKPCRLFGALAGTRTPSFPLGEGGFIRLIDEGHSAIMPKMLRMFA